MISLDQVKNLVDMLQSPDEENHLMALTTLDAIEPTDNMVPLMLCFKLGSCSHDVWKKHASTAYGYMRSTLGSDSENKLRVTFKDMFTITVNKKDVSQEFVQYVFDHYAKVLTKICNASGRVDIEDIQLIAHPVKIKKDEQPGDVS